MNVSFRDKLRNNQFLRTIWIPIISKKREWEFRNYHKRNAGKYLKSLKGICDGERCFIIGNGPSLTGDDLNLIKQEKSFAFNRIFDIYESTLWRPTYYMVSDRAVIKSFLKSQVPNLGAKDAFVQSKKLVEYWGTKMSVHEIILRGRAPIRRYEYYNRTMSEDPSVYFEGGMSVTIQAFELAFYMGFSEVYLLGVDHNFAYEVDMKGNITVNNDVQPHFREAKDKGKYYATKEALTKCYETVKEYADSHGIIVKNATRGGKLEVFDRIELENIIEPREIN